MFFEKFREAVARLPAGLIRPGRAATPHQIVAAQVALGARLPTSYVSFLESFDGADLFHEAVLLAGVGHTAPRRLVDINEPRRSNRDLVFAEAAGGDRFAFRADGQVVRLRSESDERWVAGSDFARWLDGLVAYHKLLYGPDGEFVVDAFEPDGTEMVPLMVLKQTDRALRLCPDSAEWHHERGVALRRLGQLEQAKKAFATAGALDPDNPWPWFDLGRVALTLGPGAAREAGAAFETAARLDRAEAASRLWIWAARAALLEAAPTRLAQCRSEALAREPALGEQLRRARDTARQEGDPQEIAETEALLEALEGPVPTGRVRLPVVNDEAEKPAHRPRSPDPHRPVRATPPRSGASRRGRRR